MRKKIGLLLIIFLLIGCFVFNRYNSLERKFIIANMNHLFLVKLEHANINGECIDVRFSERATTDELYDIVKDLENSCKRIISKKASYDDYTVKFTITRASYPEYSIYYDKNKKEKSLEIAPASDRDIPTFTKLLKQHTDAEEIVIFNYRVRSSDECCKIDNFNKFKNLKKIKFVKEPSDEIIRYLKEKIPNCILEYDE